MRERTRIGAVIASVAVIMIIALVLVRADQQLDPPMFRYLGESPVVPAGVTVLVKTQSSWLASEGIKVLMKDPIPCSLEKVFAFVQTYEEVTVPGAAWGTSLVMRPQAILGTCAEYNEITVATHVRTGDYIYCVGVDHGNSPDYDPVGLLLRYEGGKVSLTDGFPLREPAIWSGEVTAQYAGDATVSVIGKWSSARWCKVYKPKPPTPTRTSTPTSTPGPTPTPTEPPTSITETPTPVAVQFIPKVERND